MSCIKSLVEFTTRMKQIDYSEVDEATKVKFITREGKLYGFNDVDIKAVLENI